MRNSSVSHRLSHSITAGLLRAACLFVAPVFLITAAPSAALAQEIAQVKQYWVVPQTEDVKLRCHHGNLWYPITTVGTNTALLVDGEIDGWLRVTYPPGTPVVVRSTEAELSADRTSVKLTRKPRLRAFNKENQFLEECYKSVVIDESPNPGTSLRYLQSVKTRAGEVGGYLVEAPAGSKGFVLSTDVRRATPDEIQRAAATVAAPANPPPPQTAGPAEVPPKPVETTPAPVEEPAPSVAPVPAPVVTTPAPEPRVTTPPPPVETTPPPPAEPTPTFTPAPTTTTPTPTSTPADTIEMKPAEPAPAQPVDILVPVDQPPPAPTPAPANDVDPTVAAPVAPANAVPPQPRAPMTLEQLDRAFDQLNAESIDSAEFQPLISEYQRFLSTIPDDRSNKRLRAYVDARIQILQMKQGVQKSNAELALIRSQAGSAEAEARASAERIERTRDYLVVGRLQPSTVYDGKRLPLLYRVQAAEGGRTLAYVAPEPSSLALDSKLGMIVGVKGKGSLDPSARVTIVQATAVDVLRTGADGSYIPVNPAPVDTTYTAPVTPYTPPSATPPAQRDYSNLNPPATTTTSPSGPMLPPRRTPDYSGK